MERNQSGAEACAALLFFAAYSRQFEALQRSLSRALPYAR
jgi:hypothetical protein